MSRTPTALTLLPFGLVVALALTISIAGFFWRPPQVSTSPVPQRAAIASATPAASPSVTPTATAIPSAEPTSRPGTWHSAEELLRVHNGLRLAVGAPALRGDDRVTMAAQRHAEYLARNNTIGHDESAGTDGFTGASVRDRLAAQGYTGAVASEVATSFGSGVDGVRSLWVLPYHRLGMMHPHAVVAGWGHAQMGARSTTVGVIVYDFGSSAPDVVRSPAAGQRVAGSWHGEEFPDVLPAGAARPVGYPIMLVASAAKQVELTSARLTDASGREVSHHVVPQIYERDYVAIVPAQPLASGARYRVRLELRIAGTSVVEEWEFEATPS
jgi:uncharacterized protein YkwD